MAKFETITAAKLQEISDDILTRCFRIAGTSEECLDDVNAILRNLDSIFICASAGVARNQTRQNN